MFPASAVFELNDPWCVWIAVTRWRSCWWDVASVGFLRNDEDSQRRFRLLVGGGWRRSGRRLPVQAQSGQLLAQLDQVPDVGRLRVVTAEHYFAPSGVKAWCQISTGSG